MAGAAIHFSVRVQDLHAHLFGVTLTIAQPAALQQVSLPAWIPGSYLIREFSKNLQRLQATQGGKPVPLIQHDKCNWQAQCTADEPLSLTYEVYAFDNSVRTAWLDMQRGFFNGTSMFLLVHGQQDNPHAVTLATDNTLPGWQVATGLPTNKVDKHGFGTYVAANYEELVDCPVEMGDFWSGAFVAGGIKHRFIVAGAPPSFDGGRLLEDSKAICESAIAVWHGDKDGGRPPNKPPHTNYLFILNAMDDGYGGLEHRNSTALICHRKDLPRRINSALAPRAKPAQGAKSKQAEGYSTLLGLISHEYFHTWNVKRLRPTEFTNYDYSQENYTQLLWFFEGFTSYYDDLLLVRAGLIDTTAYLKLLTKTANQVLQTPGRLLQSAAQASFDAWVKYYRQDENTPNATVSYYSKGALIALCLDLTLRKEGKTTLDAVMRAIWQRCEGGPMRETDVVAVLADLGERSFAKEIARWVHGTADLPLKPLLKGHGLAVLEEPAQIAQRLGLRLADGPGVHIKAILRGGAAERAGFAAGDEWLAVEVGPAKSSSSWRLSKLDDLTLYAGPSAKITALVARDKRLMKLNLAIPPSVTTWRLVLQDEALANAWLNSP